MSSCVGRKEDSSIYHSVEIPALLPEFQDEKNEEVYPSSSTLPPSAPQFIGDEIYGDLILAKLGQAELMDHTHAFKSPNTLPQIPDLLPVAVHNIQEVLSAQLTFPFGNYDFKRTYHDLLNFLNQTHILLTGKPLKSIKIPGSACPRLLTAQWLTEAISACLPALKPFFSSFLDCSVEKHISDTDTHIYVDEEHLDIGIELVEALVNDLIADHHRYLSFRVTTRLDEEIRLDTIEGLEALASFLGRQNGSIERISIASGAVPWLDGVALVQNDLQSFLAEVSILVQEPKEKSTWDKKINQLACLYFFRKTLSEMQDFVRACAFEQDKTIFKPSVVEGKCIVLEARNRICLQDSEGHLHDINIIRVLKKKSLRIVFQDMYLLLTDVENIKPTFSIQACFQAIVDKYCKLIRWVEPEKGIESDWTYYWFLITQGYRDVCEGTDQILLKKFIAYCKKKDKLAELLLKSIQDEFGRHHGKNQTEAIAFAFNCAAALLKSEFPLVELNRFWRVFSESFTEAEHLIEKNEDATPLQALLAICSQGEDFADIYAQLQERAFFWLQLSLDKRKECDNGVRMTHFGGKPIIHFQVGKHTLQIDFDPLAFPEILRAKERLIVQLDEVIDEPPLTVESGSPLLRFTDHFSLNLEAYLDLLKSFSKHPHQQAKALKCIYAFLHWHPSAEDLLKIVKMWRWLLKTSISPDELERVRHKLYAVLSAKAMKSACSKMGADKSTEKKSLVCLLVESVDQKLHECALELWLAGDRVAVLDQREEGVRLYQKLLDRGSILSIRMVREMFDGGFFSFERIVQTFQELFHDLLKENQKAVQIQKLFNLAELFAQASKYNLKATQAALWEHLTEVVNSFGLAAFMLIYHELAKKKLIHDKAIILVEKLMVPSNSSEHPSQVLSILTPLKEGYLSERSNPLGKLKGAIFEKFYSYVVSTRSSLLSHIEPLCFQMLEGVCEFLAANEALDILEFYSTRYLPKNSRTADVWAHFCYAHLFIESALALQIWQTADRLGIWDSLDRTKQVGFIIALYDKLESSNPEEASPLTFRFPEILNAHVCSKKEGILLDEAKKAVQATLQDTKDPQNFWECFSRLLDLMNWRDPSEVDHYREMLVSVWQTFTKPKISARHLKTLCQLVLLEKNDDLFKGHEDALLQMIRSCCRFLEKNEFQNDWESITGKLLRKLFEIKKEDIGEDAAAMGKLLIKYPSAVSDHSLRALCRSNSMALLKALAGQSENSFLLCDLFFIFERNQSLPPLSSTDLDFLLESFAQIVRVHVQTASATIERFLDRWPSYQIANFGKEIYCKALLPCLRELISCHKEEAAFMWIQQLFLSPSGQIKSWKFKEALACAEQLYLQGYYERALTIYAALAKAFPDRHLNLLNILLQWPKNQLAPCLQRYSEVLLELLRAFQAPFLPETEKNVLALVALLPNLKSPPLSFVQLIFSILWQAKSCDQSLWIEGLKASHRCGQVEILKCAWEMTQTCQSLPEWHASFEFEKWRIKILFGLSGKEDRSLWAPRVQLGLQNYQNREDCLAYFLSSYLKKNAARSVLSVDDLLQARISLDQYLGRPENSKQRITIDLYLAQHLLQHAKEYKTFCKVLDQLSEGIEKHSKEIESCYEVLLSTASRMMKMPKAGRLELEVSFHKVCRLFFNKKDAHFFPLIKLCIQADYLPLVELGVDFILKSCQKPASVKGKPGSGKSNKKSRGKKSVETGSDYELIIKALIEKVAVIDSEKTEKLYFLLRDQNLVTIRTLLDFEFACLSVHFKTLPANSLKVPNNAYALLLNKKVSSERRQEIFCWILDVYFKVFTCDSGFGEIGKKIWSYLNLIETVHFHPNKGQPLEDKGVLGEWIMSRRRATHSPQAFDATVLLNIFINNLLEYRIYSLIPTKRKLSLVGVEKYLENCLISTGEVLRRINFLELEEFSTATHVFVQKILDIKPREPWARAAVLDIAYDRIFILIKRCPKKTKETMQLIEKFSFHDNAYFPEYFPQHNRQQAVLIRSLPEDAHTYNESLYFKLRSLCGDFQSLGKSTKNEKTSILSHIGKQLENEQKVLLLQEVIDELIKIPLFITVIQGFKLTNVILKNLTSDPRIFLKLHDKILDALDQIEDLELKAHALKSIAEEFCGFVFENSEVWNNVSYSVWKKLMRLTLGLAIQDKVRKEKFNPFNVLTLLVKNYVKKVEQLAVTDNLRQSYIEDIQSFYPVLPVWLPRRLEMLEETALQSRAKMFCSHMTQSIFLFEITKDFPQEVHPYWLITQDVIQKHLKEVVKFVRARVPGNHYFSPVIAISLFFLKLGIGNKVYTERYGDLTSQISFFVHLIKYANLNNQLRVDIIILLFSIIKMAATETKPKDPQEINLRAEAVREWILFLNEANHTLGIAGCKLFLENEISVNIFQNDLSVIKELLAALKSIPMKFQVLYNLRNLNLSYKEIRKSGFLEEGFSADQEKQMS